ncbi:aldo/keto reductase [Tropicimonas isoalkanivorans]|uniref:Predicted oxidoreductase n=1 Tax=Tropicimonas isoalkanivorans TaxID=441112 RepID=A0A1I1P5Q0_9RHOB|nr:aldo/keto reductase [Tropicimonas isoalkanivorans]SFD05137.1 Predicted oxidoreductase [Tropicimonas isoalkanivorans]
MERVELTVGLELSRIVYGMSRLADDPDRSPARIQAKIEACLEQGITSFDQADIYGDYLGEEILGAALKAAPHLRPQMEIVTKCDIVAPVGRYADRRVKYYDTRPAHIAASIDSSLRNMALERIDLLLLHRPDPLMDHYDTGRALDEAVASGKVRAVGVSNFKPHDWRLLQSAMDARLATNQIEISLLAHEPMTNGDLAFLQEMDVAPMAWSPLAGGTLLSSGFNTLNEALHEVANRHGVEASAVAVAWLLAHPACILPVVGTNTPERIGRISDAFKVDMDRQTWFTLYTAALGHEVP